MKPLLSARFFWLATALGCALAILPGQSASADQSILARGWTHQDYGRLVLDSGSDEVRDVKVVGQVMVIRFKRPVKIDMTAAVSNLRPYLISASSAADDKQLALQLRPGLDYRNFDNNGNLVLDFSLSSEKKFSTGKALSVQVSPEKMQVAAVPANAQPANSQPIGLIQPRSGEHGNYSRLAFDLPVGTSAAMRNDGGQTTLRLKGPASLDLGKLQQRLPGRVQNISARATPDGQVIDLQLKPGVEPRGMHQGRTVVLDFFDQGKAPAETKHIADNKLPSEPAIPTNEESHGSGAFAGLEPLVALPGQPIGAAKTEIAPATRPSSTTPSEIPTKPMAAATEEQPAAPASAIDVPVTVAPGANGGAILSFQWPSSTGLAAFKRGNTLWLVFGTPAHFSGKLLDAPQLAALGRVETIDSKYAVGLRLLAPSEANVPTPILNQSGNTWVIDLAPGRPAAPTKDLPQRRETLAQGGSSLLLQADHPGPVLTLPDPLAGDRLLVAPVSQAGLGVAQAAAWPEFKLLPSYQGVAAAPFANNVLMQTLPNGVVITTSPAVKPNEAQASAVPTGNAPSSQAPVPAAGIFDLPAWRRGGDAAFLKDRDELEEAITAASPVRRNDARLQLAEFLFAHGLVQEATGMLNLISDERSAPLSNKQTLTLAGAAHALNGDLDEAAKILGDPLVGSSPEASLFRGILAADRGDNEAATKFFSEPLPNLRDYPKPLRTQLGLTIIRTLIDGGNPMASQAFADAMRVDMPDAETTDRLSYLDGLRQLKLGKTDEAFKKWEALNNSQVDDVKAESQFAIINEKLRTKKMTPAEAVEPLEALRFLSRGGGFEFALLRKLGEVYIEADQPRRGLLTLRQAVTNFAARPESKDVAQEMTDAFRDLYLQGGADRLSPLTAVALYDEFRELTPSGPDGDRMIAGLADRLVKVDLLDGAANLLDTQVKHRLSGVDKARAGARLAAIRLLDNKPELADQALKNSMVTDALPEDVIASRRQLQAQADFGQGQTLQALDEIKDDDSLSARWLRADMLWQLQEWPAAADALGQVMEAEETNIARQAAMLMAKNDVAIDPAAALRDASAPATTQASDDAQSGPATFTDVMNRLRNDAFKERLGRVVLNRAVAMSLSGDRSGLRSLARQYGKNMAQTNLAKSFTMLTSPSNGLADSVSAEMASVDQISSFVDEYRARLRQASLSNTTATN
ncbi:hypothetical protein ACFPL7_06880 [Dongia soli]|uniref:Tetratricopeptide repeat protein n=1 Tax=Dongia soli TaxID=600628 RepID=A0ABU5E9X4_9PROT|nr:hypothetical protein [Dongia soli]MDY0882666.1 hypothetical protein [Dongia soli]